MSPNDKIYYSVVVLIAAVSVLLSPFFYVRRAGSGKVTGQPKKPVAWRLILASYVIVGAILLALAYVIFFKQ